MLIAAAAAIIEPGAKKYGPKPQVPPHLRCPEQARAAGDEPAAEPSESPNRAGRTTFHVAQEPVRPERTGREETKLTLPAPGRTIRMRVTAYCPCSKCCGRYSRRLNGKYVNATACGARVDLLVPYFVAADPAVIPMGTTVFVPGYADGRPVAVLDTGGAITGNRIDVYFDDHDAALEWGVRELDVTVFDTVADADEELKIGN